MAKKQSHTRAAYKVFPDNPRFISDEEFLQLAESLGDFGSLDGIVVNISQGKYHFAVISGNQKAAIIGLDKLSPNIIERFEEPTRSGTIAYGFCVYKDEQFPYREVYWSNEKCEIANIRANNFGGHNDPKLLELFSDEVLRAAGIDMDYERQVFELLAHTQNEENSENDTDGDSGDNHGARATLAEKFIIPPFSILDTRQGYWIERKRAWKAIIGDNGESRQHTLSKSEGSMLNTLNDGVSLLDPVLAECMVHWFAPSGKARIFDPFAGDTVFGYVAATKGHEFTGIELREEQANLNAQRVAGLPAKYICDDAQNVGKYFTPGSMDLLFSCPPYFDLEVYSSDERDASNQKDYEAFFKILDNAFAKAINCLKSNRFAVIVVGDIRDKDGFYRKFPDDVKSCFHANGMRLYNEIILVESLGTLPQRVAKWMNNRKVGKCHQNVLVFYKGDTKKINRDFPSIEFDNESANLEP